MSEICLFRLSIKDAFTYDVIRIPLHDQGLISLRGPNGTGKSGMWDILDHILYGVSTRGIQKDGLIRVGSEGGYIGVLEFKKDNDYYVIVQTRDHAYGDTVKAFKHDNEKDNIKFADEVFYGTKKTILDRDSEVTPKKGQVKSQELIRDVIWGIPQQQFYGHIYLGQRAGHPLVSGNGAECAKYLSSTFGYNVYDNIREKIKFEIDGVNDSTVRFDEIQILLKDYENKLLEFGDLSTVSSAKAQLEEECHDMEKQIKSVNEQIDMFNKASVLKDSISRMVDNLVPKGILESQIKLIESDTKTINKEIESLNLIIEQAKTYGVWSVQNNKLKSDIVTCTNELQKFEKEYALPKLILDHPISSVRINEFLKFSDADFELEDNSDVINKLEIELGVKKSSIKTLEETIENLEKYPDNDICDSCKQVIPKEIRSEHESNLVIAKNKLLELEEETSIISMELNLLNVSQRKFISLKSFLDSLGEERQEIFLNNKTNLRRFFTSSPKDLYQNIITTHARYYKLHEEIKTHSLNEPKVPNGSPDVQRLKELQGMSEQLNSKKHILSVELSKYETIEDNKKQLNEILKGNPCPFDIEEEISILKIELSNLDIDLKGNQNKIVENKIHLEKAREVSDKIKSFKNELETLKKSQRRLTLLKILHKSVYKLKIRRIHKAIELIKEILPKYTSIFFKERIDFDISDEDPESIQLLASHNGLPPISINGLSKGELGRLRVSLLWTLREVINPKNKVNILILDEADDGLDEQGLEAYSTLLNKVKDKYSTMVVITHRGLAVNYDCYWHVGKTNNITNMRMS